MRRRITWRTAAAISMFGLAPGIGAAFAVPAQASTNGCLAAVSTQCGTFTALAYSDGPPGGDSGGQGWDVKGASSAINTPLIEGKNYSPGSDPGTDLTKVEHWGAIPGAKSTTPGYWYSFVYMPSGKWSSMCLSNPNNKGKGGTNLVLRPCSQNKWQAFLIAYATNSTTIDPEPSSSEQIGNGSSTADVELYNVANGKAVQGEGRGKVLPATGRAGAAPTTNLTWLWYWTNANGTS